MDTDHISGTRWQTIRLYSVVTRSYLYEIHLRFVFKSFRAVISFLAPPISAVFLLGILSKRINEEVYLN